MNDIAGFISTVGFPIAVTLYLLWDRATIMKRFTQIMDKNIERTDAHIQRTSELKQAVQELTYFIRATTAAR